MTNSGGLCSFPDFDGYSYGYVVAHCQKMYTKLLGGWLQDTIQLSFSGSENRASGTGHMGVQGDTHL